jgi:hypothetical protein
VVQRNVMKKVFKGHVVRRRVNVIEKHSDKKC